MLLVEAALVFSLTVSSKGYRTYTHSVDTVQVIVHTRYKHCTGHCTHTVQTLYRSLYTHSTNTVQIILKAHM